MLTASSRMSAYQLSRAMAAQKRKNGLILILIFLALGILAVGVYAFVLPGHSINGLREALTQKPDISTAELRQQVRGSNNPNRVMATTATASLSGIPVQIKKGSPTSTDLEAAKVALDLWKPTKIGKSYYLFYYLYQANYETKAIFELRGPMIYVRPQEISEADKLNGLEWKGRVNFASEATRSCLLASPDAPINQWSEWWSSAVSTDAGFSFELVKSNNGKWVFHREGGHPILTFAEITEADIPK